MAELFDEAVVQIAKLRDYCLSESHFRGRHKARVFRSRLGLTARDAEQLRDWLLRAAAEQRADLRPTGADPHGRRFVLDTPITTPAGRAVVRSVWIVRLRERVLRLTTCYVL